ncbi:MAG: hypothetical protein Tsb008_20310 [Rhodothalassiaceae bacterium]
MKQALLREETETIIGLALPMPLERGPEIEVGYRLAPAYWGRGYASECAACLVHYGLETLGLARIVAVVMEENAASARVLMKCGLRPAGRVDAYGQTDLLRFVILRDREHAG